MVQFDGHCGRRYAAAISPVLLQHLRRHRTSDAARFRSTLKRVIDSKAHQLTNDGSSQHRAQRHAAVRTAGRVRTAATAVASLAARYPVDLVHAFAYATALQRQGRSHRHNDATTARGTHLAH
jgi:hypothetical protein